MKNNLLIKRKSDTFSLLELIIVLIIIGIIFTFAMPSYRGTIERNKGKAAIYTLGAIYSAEKRYRLDHNGTYYTCAPACSISLIKQNLDVGISDPYFNYTIIADGGVGFIARATRANTGICANLTMEVNATSGQVDTSACDYWH